MSNARRSARRARFSWVAALVETLAEMMGVRS